MMSDGIEVALAERMPDREIRHYPALVSTEAEARRWAAEGAAAGSVVLAGYQAAPRGRGGVVWEIPPTGIGFSMILRPALLEHQEGRMYMWGALAVSGLCESPGIGWPDAVTDEGIPFGTVAVHAMIDLLHVEWAVLSVMLMDAGRVPSKPIARILADLDSWMTRDSTAVRDCYEARLDIIGRDVSAHLMPIGPKGRRIEGRVVGTDEDCALRIETGQGRVTAVRPQHVGLLEVTA